MVEDTNPIAEPEAEGTAGEPEITNVDVANAEVDDAVDEADVEPEAEGG